MWFNFYSIGCNFVTREAKHSSQKFNINTRNIHKGIFLVIFDGVLVYVTLPRCILTCKRSGLVCFFSILFSSIVSDKFGKKYDPFSLLSTGQNLLGAWCKRPWGGYFFIALKHGADTFFFAVSSHASDTFFHYLEANKKIFTEKNVFAAIFFTEITDSDWNAVAHIEVTWKKILTPRAASTANTIIFFDDSTSEKNTIYRSTKYFVS